MDRLPVADDDDELMTVGGPIWDVIKVEIAGPLSLRVEFEDGLKGTVRFDRSYLRGVFAKLDDPWYFEQVGICHGAVSWPNEEPDMAPDRMYDELVAGNGEWIVN
jgi:hypothetical protein